MSPERESPVELRCAAGVVKRDAVLQCHDRGGWVLSGGWPRSHESMQSRARPERPEETGLDVQPNGCGRVFEVDDAIGRRRIEDPVVVAGQLDAATRLSSEFGRFPVWVNWDDLKGLTLQPPIGGFLPELGRRDGEYGRYANTWRPQRGDL